MHYGRQLTLTNVDLFTPLGGMGGLGELCCASPGDSLWSRLAFSKFMGGDYLHSMMLVAIKQVYGYVIWFSLILASIFLLCDIPAVRTNIRKVPRWPVLAIEYLARRRK